jgi:hypothetical protein
MIKYAVVGRCEPHQLNSRHGAVEGLLLRCVPIGSGRAARSMAGRRGTGFFDPHVCPTARNRWLPDAACDARRQGFGGIAKTLSFSAICRALRRGGTRIRTGDTMIFSHMQKPLPMRIYRIGKRIYVHRVPLDTILFCPYCCATVDTPFVALRDTGRGGLSLVHLLA